MRRTASHGKQKQLVAAAAGLFHKRGVEATSLKDVAECSKIPLGSVYYYYPTKDDLTAAVVARRHQDVARLTGQRAEVADPAQRLIALIDVWISDSDVDARYGCPIGSLCLEVARARRLDAAAPFKALIAWCSEQFRALGQERQAETRAVHLTASLQGISLLACVLADPRLIEREATLLKDWIRGIAAERHGANTSGARRAARRGARTKRSTRANK